MLDTGIADSSDATVLTFDSSENALFHGHVDLGDGQRIRFGDSDDYHIHHNANGVTYVAGNVVEHNANTWRIKNLAGTETIINAAGDGAVSLYYDNNTKLATSSDGIDVTGKIDCTTFQSTGAATVGGNLTVTGNLQVDGTTTTINSTTYTVDDLNITLASGAGSSSAADGAGITIDGASATWNYVHSNTSWVSNKNVRAPRFLTTSNASSNFYSLLATRSGSGTSNPDLYGTNNTLVLGYSDSSKAVSFDANSADFAGDIKLADDKELKLGDSADIKFKHHNSGYGHLENTGILYIDAEQIQLRTDNSSIATGITIDDGQTVTVGGNFIVNGGSTLGNDDTDIVAVPGPLAVDTDTLYVNVTNDRVGINVGTSPLNALSVSGVITSNNVAAVGVGGTPSDANFGELGPGYINLARDDTANAKQLLFGKNGSVHSYLETASGGLNIGGANVGIGSTNPYSKFDVVGKIRATQDIVSNTHYHMIAFGSNRSIDDYGGVGKDYWRIGMMTPGSSTTGESSAHGWSHLVFSGVTGANQTYSNRMCIDNNGYVGIGTMAPGIHLDISSTDQNVLRLDTTNSDGPLHIFRNNGTVRGYIGNAEGILGKGVTNFGMRAQAALYFGTGGNNTRMIINSSGNVGLGPNEPSARLHVDECTNSVAGLMLEGNGNGDVIHLQLKAKANNGTLSYHGLVASPGSDQDDNTISLGNGANNGVVVDHQNVVTTRYIKSHGGGTYSYDVGGSYISANGADFGTHAIFRTPSVTSPSSGSVTTQFLTTYSSGHWGEYPVCRFRVYGTYFNGSYREYLFRMQAGSAYLQEVELYASNNTWGASPGTITKGSVVDTGSDHSGQNIYKCELSFTTGGAYYRNYVVVEINYGANVYYSSGTSVSTVDGSTNGGKYHFKTISSAEGRGYFV